MIKKIIISLVLISSLIYNVIFIFKNDDLETKYNKTYIEKELLKDEISKYVEDIDNKNKEIENFKQLLNEKENIINEKDNNINTLNQKIKELEEERKN